MIGLARKANRHRPNPRKRMVVPSRPAFDFFARSQMMKAMKAISPPTRAIIIHFSNTSGSTNLSCPTSIMHAGQAGAGPSIRPPRAAQELASRRLVGSRFAAAKQLGGSVVGLDDVDALAQHFGPGPQILLFQLGIVFADGL